MKSTVKRRDRGGEWWWRVWALLPWAIALGVATSVVCSAIAYVVTAEDWFVSAEGERRSIEGESLSIVEFKKLGRTFYQVTAYPTDKDVVRSSVLASEVTGPLLPFRDSILDERTQGIGGTVVYCFATGFPMRLLPGRGLSRRLARAHQRGAVEARRTRRTRDLLPAAVAGAFGQHSVLGRAVAGCARGARRDARFTSSREGAVPRVRLRPQG